MLKKSLHTVHLRLGNIPAPAWLPVIAISMLMLLTVTDLAGLNVPQPITIAGYITAPAICAFIAGTFYSNGNRPKGRYTNHTAIEKDTRTATCSVGSLKARKYMTVAP